MNLDLQRKQTSGRKKKSIGSRSTTETNKRKREEEHWISIYKGNKHVEKRIRALDLDLQRKQTSGRDKKSIGARSTSRTSKWKKKKNNGILRNGRKMHLGGEATFATVIGSLPRNYKADVRR